MRAGDTLESAMWLDGRESDEALEAFKSSALEAVAQQVGQAGFGMGPPRWTEKRPGQDRVPPLPGSVNGPNIRLLVLEVDVLDPPSDSKFLADLDRIDLHRLRAVTRRVHAQHYPGQRLTDRQCDTIINDLGPDAALDVLRGAPMSVH